MDRQLFFYKLHLVDSHGNPVQFLGNAFPVVPNGGLITCRHVVDLEASDNSLAIFDNETNSYKVISQVVYAREPKLDLAFLPNALQRSKAEFFPILRSSSVQIGEDVYSFGHYAFGGLLDNLTMGYFAGKLVNVYTDKLYPHSHNLTLPYPVIEGLSGSPVLTYHNGVKLVGLCHGSQQARILAAEILEYKDTEREYRETIHRMVEFGVAYHAATIIDFLNSISAQGFVVSEERTNLPGLS